MTARKRRKPDRTRAVQPDATSSSRRGQRQKPAHAATRQKKRQTPGVTLAELQEQARVQRAPADRDRLINAHGDFLRGIEQ